MKGGKEWRPMRSGVSVSRLFCTRSSNEPALANDSFSNLHLPTLLTLCLLPYLSGSIFLASCIAPLYRFCPSLCTQIRFSNMRLILALFCALALAFSAAPALAQEDAECEVCVSVLEKFAEAGKAAEAKSVEDYEKVYRKSCKGFDNAKDKRLCWYLGGAADSATNILREVSRPMSIGVPSLSICRRLRAKDASICSLRYSGNSVSDPTPEKKKPAPKKPKAKKGVKVDWAGVPKMRVKELRALLADLGETCTDCMEKPDFVARVMALKPKDGADKAEL